MTTQIATKINDIAKVELEKKGLLKQLEEATNLEKEAKSKQSILNDKLAIIDGDLNKHYDMLKDLIKNGSI